MARPVNPSSQLYVSMWWTLSHVEFGHFCRTMVCWLGLENTVRALTRPNTGASLAPACEWPVRQIVADSITLTRITNQTYT
jgi:hypothetical protein